MANQNPGEPPEPPLICPNSECEEEIDKEDDGSYPTFCSFCGEKLFKLETKCPSCKAVRKKSKKTGLYGTFCHKCPYHYTTGEMRDASKLKGASMSTPAAESKQLSSTETGNANPTPGDKSDPPTQQDQNEAPPNAAQPDDGKNLPQQVPDSSTQPPVPESADTKVQHEQSKAATYAEKAALKIPSGSSQSNEFSNNAYERFCDVRIKIDKAPSSATDLDGRTLAVDGTELKIVEDLASKGLEIEEQYQRSIEQLRKAKSDEDKNRTKQLVDQSIRDFEKFVPETSKANVEEVILKLEAVQQENETSQESLATSLASSGSGSRCRRVEFWAFIPDRVKQYFTKNKISYSLQIRANNTHHEWNEGPPLLTLTKSKNGLWKGECQNIPRETLWMEYTYCFVDKKTKTKFWEVLSIKNNRHIAFPSEDDYTVYDGTVLLDSEKWRIEWINDWLSDQRQSKEQVEGCDKMLPAVKEELENGATIGSLKTWLDSVALQQEKVFSGFYPDASDKGERELADVLQSHFTKQVEKQIKHMKEKKGNTCNYWKAMIILLYLGTSKKFQKRSSYYDFPAKEITNLIEVSISHCVKTDSSWQSVVNSTQELSELERSQFSDALKVTIQGLSASSNNKWLLLISLYHRFKNYSTETRPDNEEDELWWGTKGFDKEVQDLKSSHRQDKAWETWLAMVKPSFPRSNLLPYTFLALLTGHQLISFLNAVIERRQPINELPTDGVIACVKHHIQRVAKNHRLRQPFFQILHTYLQRVDLPQWPITNAANRLAKFASSLLNTFKVNTAEGYAPSWQDVKVFIDVYLNLLGLYGTVSGDQAVPEDAGNLILEFSSNYLPTRSTTDKVAFSDFDYQLWERMFDFEANNTVVRTWWKQSWAEKLTHVLKTKYTESSIFPMIFRDIRVEEMREVLNSYALSISDWWLQNESEQYLWNTEIAEKVCEFINHGTLQALEFKHEETRVAVVLQMLKWKTFSAVYKFCKQSLHHQNYQVESKLIKQLELFIETFTTVMLSVISGAVTLEEFAQLKPFKAKAIELCTLSGTMYYKGDDLEHAFAQREKELFEYGKFLQIFSSLWQICKVSFEDPQHLDEWLSHPLSQLTFAEIIDPMTLKVTCDLIPETLRALLPKIDRYKHQQLFRNVLIENLTNKRTWGEITPMVELSISQYDQLISEIVKGSIEIQKIKELQNTYFDGCKGELVSQLPAMILNNEVCKERTQQINICVELEKYHSGAVALLDIKKMFKLSGNFSNIESLAGKGELSLKLHEITADLTQSADIIKEITELQMNCLKAFVECSEFVEWIREAVKKTEVTVFVELASYTLGEDGLGTKQTRSLLNCLTGYSPLLYDYCPEGTDLTNFMELCRKVWKNLETNPELPENLRNSSSQIAVLQKTKTSYGKTEMTAVHQAKKINDSGLYRVGKIETSSDIKTLDDVISLTCEIESGTGEEKETKKKTYTYSELKDLQGQLALVAGEKHRLNTDAIEQFGEMRDAVENLGATFMAIKKAGCILFDDMLVAVHCNPESSVGVQVTLQAAVTPLYGLTKERLALDHCQKIYAYLTNCLRKWGNIMDSQRQESPELNFYTTEQLVMLRKELGKFSYTEDCSMLKNAIPLLAFIHPIKADELLALTQSYNKNNQTEERENSLQKFTPYTQMSRSQKDTVDYIMSEHDNLSNEKAVVIVNLFGEEAASDPEKVAKWLKEQQEIEAAQKDPGESSGGLLSKIMQEAVEYNQASLKDQLESIWQEFADKTKQSLRDVLSVSHLGYVLHAVKDLSYVPNEKRELPSWLNAKRGKPVLIGMPAADTFKMVLTIYEADRKFNRPTTNEVLICNVNTRKEEVALFLRRALEDTRSYYCMVNCHLLRYDICQSIENRLNNLADFKNSSFGLAFIYDECAKNSRIRAYLDKYLLRNVQITDVKKLKSYVQELLTTNVQMSACCVDPERSLARVITSKRAGVGKSLQHKNFCDTLRNIQKVKGKDITITAHNKIFTDGIVSTLTEELGYDPPEDSCDFIHLDIAHEVEFGVDELLFNLIILQSLVNSDGVVWQVKTSQYYVIECMPFIKQNGKSAHEVLDLLPTITCITPMETFAQRNVAAEKSPGFDKRILVSPEWQLVLKHLECADEKKFKFDIDNMQPITDSHNALRLLISYCGLKDPTWSELRHYVHFLSHQLNKVISSPFCGPVYAEDLPGFKTFVINFMLNMAQDFATRSLKIAEETPGKDLNQLRESAEVDELLKNLEIKKTWEQSDCPYLFFNPDGESFSTLGFHVVQENKRYVLVNKKTKKKFANYSMSPYLFHALKENKLSISEDFDALSRKQKLKKLRQIMVKQVAYFETTENGSESVPMFQDGDDPDPNYVLTIDNAKKIIAIHQRLCVDIPVVIMGETGCGKTKLIEFMSKLQIPTALKKKLQTMVIVRVHGGTTEADIMEAVEKSQKLAAENQALANSYGEACKAKDLLEFYTILFFDEVNTTEAIGLVKELLCDGRMNGKKLKLENKLKIIAACNPYRRHSEDMIKKLREAGLGYHVEDDETLDRFGHIPMRHLVYRVQPLPQSLLPLVWDFGTLQSESAGAMADNSVESEYIKHMVLKFDKDCKPEEIHFKDYTTTLATLLSISQSFMRKQKDECSFVSLRDVHRLLHVSNWFFTHRSILYTPMDQLKSKRPLLLMSGTGVVYYEPNDIVRSILLGIGVCYLARLETKSREKYINAIRSPLQKLVGSSIIGHECLRQQIELCQDFLINEVVDVDQHENIAKNKALKENVFMMIVCIETKIPLFVIGKPGSSKSLSKSMVLDAMKGDASRKEIFKALKNTYVASFQCSRHASTEGIIGIFKHCATFQQKQDLKKFVSVVVLDEVGLAEDSENMPLKALHPLLEDGCVGNEEAESHKKCAFIGISNWALDPAKMNRGIFIQIGTPANNELEHIAREICRSSSKACREVEEFITPLSNAYKAICAAQKPEGRHLTEFFGLRDFYSLMKMVVNFARSTGHLNRDQLEHSIKRNFGGFDPDKFNPMKIFTAKCPAIDTLKENREHDPPTDPIGLIKSSLFGITNLKSESRYLLILTENLSVLSLILDQFEEANLSPEVVFGSRFSDDVSYTQVCHNLYRIKMCMDIGRPVILLNLDDLYESLYDALNQYFSKWGNQKFVDLGLGTHRVKAYVNDAFRLVLIADKKKVHAQFPIPLINRLEKHYISATSLLSDDQKRVKKKLEVWMEKFIEPNKLNFKSCPAYCDNCKEQLLKPYRLPCQHYVGHCCREKLFKQGLTTCPVVECKEPLPDDFEWKIDERALESRHYFESASVTSSFIGYSTEFTALVVRRATKEAMDAADRDFDKLMTHTFEISKKYLLQCATAESILRLDRTVLKDEASMMQRIYLTEQHHENLLQYLNFELPRCDGKPLNIQVTTFAELMSGEDINALQSQLNQGNETYGVETIYLRNFSKESLFTEAIKAIYSRPAHHKANLLIIQCESANESMELLDSVRYIIQRESLTRDKFNHTVLLLSVARGHPFPGYQGGSWKCVHIDDPRTPRFNLPSLSKCMGMKPCEIIGQVLENMGGNKELKPRENVSDEEYDDQQPPPLEDVDEVVEPMEIDVENVEAERVRVEQSQKLHIEDIKQFIEYCLPHAVSIIRSSSSYDRVSEIIQLFEQSQEFLMTFLTYVHQLLCKQDEHNTKCDWVKTDAANSKNMKKSETLRHALVDSLERAFRPAIAAVIAFVDPSDNLKLFRRNPALQPLWNELFSQCSKLGLNFDQLTKVSATQTPSSRLPQSFIICQAGKSKMTFENNFPFSSLIKDVIDRQMSIATQGVLRKDKDGNWLINPLKETQVGKILLVDQENSELCKEMFLAYLHDFVYLAYSCVGEHDHWILEQVLLKHTETEYGDKASIPHIHLCNDELKKEMSHLISVLHFNMEQREESLSSKVKEKLKSIHESVQPEVNIDESATENETRDQQNQGNKSSKNKPDIIALEILIGELSEEPLGNLLSNPEKWISHIDQCKLLMEKILDSETHAGREGNIGHCETLWAALELKKLYVQHVMMPTTDPRTGKKKSQQLMLFTKGVEEYKFHEKQSFDQVVEVLKKLLRKRVCSLYDNCPTNCGVCNESLDAPAKLPCGHIICDSCTSQALNCPKCSEKVPENYKYNPQADSKITVEKLDDFKEFRNGLNNFFKSFVAELVFRPGKIPDNEVIEWLVQRITFSEGIREFSLFNCEDIVDATPALRSFLIKLFLKCPHTETVFQHIDDIIGACSSAHQLSQLPILVMLMNCHKDLWMYDVQQCTDQMLTQGLQTLANKYKQCRGTLTKPSMAALTYIANLHCTLSQTVQLILTDKENTKKLQMALKRLLEVTCIEENRQIGYYVIRQLKETVGESYIKDLINTNLSFMIPRNVKDFFASFNVADIFNIFAGEEYQHAKDMVNNIIGCDESRESLNQALKNFEQSCRSKDSILLYAVFSRLSRSFADAVPVSQTVLSEVQAYLSSYLVAKPLTSKMVEILLNKDKMPPEVDVSLSKGVNMMMLVLHVFSCTSSAKPTEDIFPLTEIITQPLQAALHFLPTMKENPMEVMQAAYMEEKYDPQREYHELQAYYCPNGHVYFITNCGKPVMTSRCFCGELIGGKKLGERQYSSSANNRALDKEEMISAMKSKPGHILGHAVKRSPVTDQERQLNPLSCSILRCLVHISMYTSSLFSDEVFNMIDPKLNSPEEIRPFLEAHIQIDLQQISQCCGKNIDDCILLLHDVIERLQQTALYNPANNEECILKDTKAREAWEATFDTKYIKQVFANEDKRLSSLKSRVITPEAGDLKELLSTENSPLNDTNILASPGLWEYERPLTIVAIQNQINASDEECKYLGMFVSNCDKLMAVKYLPDVLALIRVVREKFHCQFSRKEAKSVSALEIIARHAGELDLSQQRLTEMINSFTKSWNLAITSADFTADDQAQPLTDDLPLSEILIDKHDRHLSRAKQLIEFLVDSHNEMIPEQRQTVTITEVTQSLPVSLDSRDEIITLVSAHRDYKVGAEASQSYNLQAVEHEISLKYIGTRAKIQLERNDYNSLYYTFQEDFNLLNQMKILEENQAKLDKEAENSICGHASRTIQILTTNLKELNIIINYLSVMPEYDSEQSLKSFMKTTIGSVPKYLTDDIKLKHVLHVWTLLKYAQADSLMHDEQEPFDDIDVNYKEHLKPELHPLLEDCCTYNSSRTRALLQQLFEYIIFRLNRDAILEDFEDPENSLHNALLSSVMRRNMTDWDRFNRIQEDLPELPENILAKHAADVWCRVWRKYITKVDI